MRTLSVALGMLIVGTFLVAMTPSSTAVGYCVKYVKEPTYDDCDGLVCIGYNQNGWQNCVPPEIYCLHNPCCHYDPEYGTFYCP